MTIDQKTLEKWQLMKKEGDLKELMEITGSTYPTLKKAFETGKCKKLLFKAIDKYYKQRARKLLEVINR